MRVIALVANLRLGEFPFIASCSSARIRPEPEDVTVTGLPFMPVLGQHSIQSIRATIVPVMAAILEKRIANAAEGALADGPVSSGIPTVSTQVCSQ